MAVCKLVVFRGDLGQYLFRDFEEVPTAPCVLGQDGGPAGHHREEDCHGNRPTDTSTKRKVPHRVVVYQ